MRLELMAGTTVPRPVREYRFVATLYGRDVTEFREALVDLADGFTESATDRGTRYVVGLRGRGAKQRMLRFLAQWAHRTRKGRIDLEDRDIAPDQDEVYFLLPLQRNPDPARARRLPLFTNEQLAGFRKELAWRFHFRPETVQVYGEWRNDAGQLIPDYSFLIRVPRRGRGTIPALRKFIRHDVLAAQGCDQDYIYLSTRWRGEFVVGA